MNTGIEVKVFYLESESDVDRQEMGLKIDLKDCVLKDYKLYHIDFITRYDATKCIVSSGGEDFIINESYESVNARIEQR